MKPSATRTDTRATIAEIAAFTHTDSDTVTTETCRYSASF